MHTLYPATDCSVIEISNSLVYFFEINRELLSSTLNPNLSIFRIYTYQWFKYGFIEN